MNKKLIKGLIVSCQALEDEPLHSPYIMSKMSKAAVEGGAIAIRANGYYDIVAIKNEVSVPVIGLIKSCYQDSDVYITPTMKEIDLLAKANCDIIAVDATTRKRPNGKLLEDIIKETREKYPNIELMADISSYEDAINADKLGFDYISTTLSGYTEESKDIQLPNIDLLKQLKSRVSATLVAEGGIWTLDHIKDAVEAGVDLVVIGTAITRPQEITKRYNHYFNQIG